MAVHSKKDQSTFTCITLVCKIKVHCSVLYVQDSLESEAQVFLDPNKLSEDDTVALAKRCFSDDGEFFAYSLSNKGSDWVTIKFMKVDGQEQLPDTLENAKFTSMAWTHDNKGLFYKRYPIGKKADGTETDLNLNQKDEKKNRRKWNPVHGKHGAFAKETESTEGAEGGLSLIRVFK